MNSSQTEQGTARIPVVDDIPANLNILSDALEEEGEE